MKKSKFLLGYILILATITRADDNTNALPDDNVQCYTCNSEENADCVTNPTSTLVQPCTKKNDTCGIIIKGTATIRGCSSDIGDGDQQAHPCAESKCNYGLFPTDRLQCYQCTNCLTSPPEKSLRPCRNYADDDQCFTDVIDETTILRGCLSDKPNKQTDFIQKCEESKCNNQDAIETLKCKQCKSEQDSTCMTVSNDATCKITTQDECVKHTLLGRNNETACYTYVKDGKVERGCTENKKINDKYYEYCFKDNCNEECQEPIKCFKCSSDDPNCATTTNLQPDTCDSDIACSTCWDDNGSVTRSCGVQNKDTCVSCQNGDGCNSYTPLQCYSCSSTSNNNCASWKNTTGIAIETCKDPNEQCATILIEGTTIERGCRIPEKVACPADSPNCNLCADSKCNNNPFPKDIRTCIQCSGPQCADEQDQQNSIMCDVYLPDDSCFVYADKNGVAHRGCASNAPDYAQCQESGHCWLCHGDGCNTNKVRKCYSCSSDFEGNCTSWNDQIKSETCSNPDDVCTTILTDNKVERGCKPPKTCKSGDSSCVECSDSDNCNNNKISPKLCLQCSITSDCKRPNGKNATICKRYAKDSGCYVYASENEEVYRGCTSNTEEVNKCDNATNGNCWTCLTDGCNSQSLPSCLTCKAPLQSNCAKVIAVNLIKSQICSNPSDQCTSYLDKDNSTVVRGCQPTSKNVCGFNSKTCKTCTGVNCNNNPIPRTEISCVQCSGTDDCKNVQTVVDKSNVCSTFESCFTYSNSLGKVYRGCLKTEDDLSKCKSESNNNCWTCNKDTCNSAEVLKCFSCESDISGDCATWKNTTTISTETCHNPTEVCATVVTENKVERGCKDRSIAECHPGDPQCQKCYSDNCNQGDVTMKPIRCIQCSDSDDCVNSQDSKSATICEKYVAGSGCFTYGDENGIVTRGCTSNTIELNKCNTTTNGNCETCTNDGCNHLKMSRCYSCTSKLDENCATGKNLTNIPSKACKNIKDMCISYLYNDTTVKRACHPFLDITPKCEINSPDCKICHNKDNCNIDYMPRKKIRCAECSGTDECKNDQKSSQSNICSTYESCYVYTNSSGNVFRGCLSTIEDYTTCINESNINCWSCKEDGCNINKVKTCYSCESQDDENCVTMTNPKLIKKQTCHNPEEICLAFRKGQIVERGCKSPDAIQCSPDDPMCRKCNEDNCNTASLAHYPKKCVRCSGIEDCIQSAQSKYCDKFVENDKCYAYADKSGQVFRGCMSSTEEYKKCEQDTDGKCWTCTKDGCNKIKMPRCYTCSSGLNGNCATAKNINNIQSQFCQNPFDHCVSRLVNETIVQRGCQPLTEIDPNCGLNSENCKTCEGTDNCNLDPIPRKKNTCIECSGTDDCKNGKTSESKTCSTYESCYIYRNASGNVFRGCIFAAEDFNKCVTASKSNCWTCKGNECNAEKLQKCYTCESDISGDCSTFKNANEIPSETCHNPEQVCAAVRAGDRVQRGCKLPESLYCKPGDLMCRSCKKDNCNDGSLATYPAKCIKCSGTEDCVNMSDPKEASYCEKNVEGEPCYAYADKDGKIFRGCVSNEEEYDKCQNSTNGHCWKCNGDGCNNIRFSHCLSCKSPSDENCAKLHDLNSIPSKVCQIPTQHCISQIVNKTAERGCYSVSEFPSNCVFNSPNCKTCNKDDCNTETMPRNQTECTLCVGTDGCQNEQYPTNSSKCTTYESCYVFRNTIGKINRGCISKLEDFTSCINAGNGFCWTCSGPTCNTPKVRSCYTCKSDVNGNCATWNNPNLIGSQICQNPDEICATITLGKMVERRCEKPENVHCEPGDATCQKCTTDNCNKGIVHENPKRCHICSGTDECRLEQLAVNEQSCDGIEDACYVYTNENGQVFRGCMSNKDEYDNCKKAGNGTCWTCTTDGCNKDKVLECFTCTSVDNLNCAVWNGTNGIRSKICKNPDEICVSNMKEGQIVRECKVPSEICPPYSGTCQNCKEDKCNAGTIPKVELRCYQCSKTDDCQEEQNSTNLSLCSTTETNPLCWAYSDINGKMIRGCTGDKAEFKKCQDTGICRLCNTDGCNKFPYRSTPSLQCHKCNDTEACGWGQSNNTISPCINKFAYYLKESCITLKKDNNFERGCTLDLGTCQGNEQMCQTCNTTAACNNANIIKQSCVQCKSTDDQKCAGTAEGIGGKECPTTFTPFDDRGCYTRTVGKGVERGCSQGLSAEDLSTCKNDKNHKQCEYCDSQDCNNKKAPSAASVTAVLTVGLVVLSIVIQTLS